MVTLHDALGYLDRGLAVIPIKAGTKQAKHGWKKYQGTRPTESQVRQWFVDDGQTAVAVILGDVSGGLVCRDFDVMPAYERWQAEHPVLARTLPTVETGRPGRHVYARADIDQIRAASASGGTILEFDDGELRGGGLCLLPPSIHPNGLPYRWLTPLSDELPKVDVKVAGFIPAPCHIEHTGLHKTLRGSSVSTVSSVLHPSSAQAPEGTVLSPRSPRPPHSSVGVKKSPPSERIELAIACALPTKSGQRHRMLFDLARALKGVPELASQPVAALKPYVRQWHTGAVQIIETKNFDESWLDFCESWDKVKWAKGQGPLAELFARAAAATPPPEAEQYDTPAVRLLVSLCRELQRRHGTEPFFLGCRIAAELLGGIDHTTAARWLKLLRHDRIIELCSTGSMTHVASPGSRAIRRASCYRYLKSLTE